MITRSRRNRHRRWRHEVTLIATQISDAGQVSIVDVVETSRHFASHYTRRWAKDSEIHAIAAFPASEAWHGSEAAAQAFLDRMRIKPQPAVQH